MKTLIKTILISSIIMLSNFAFGQAPEGINYQATVRDASGNLMISQTVAVAFAIRETSPTGTVVYQETQNLTTNAFGGFNVVIGNGTASTGTFAGIDWADKEHFLNVTVNGNNLGTTQMMSVPYALNAKTANSLSDPIWKKRISNGDVFTIGEPIIIGDSVQSASRLTIRDNSGGSEMIDLIKTNSGNGDDVINMNVTTTGIGQFIEAHSNGDNKFSINTNGIMNIDSTITIADGEINRNKTSTANLVPIAYGYVSSTGVKSSIGSTNNWTVARTGTGSYSIAITGENYFFNRYATSVTVSVTVPSFISASSGSGNMLVRSYSSSGSLADRSFYFIVYKP